MTFVSVTRLHIRGQRFFPSFAWYMARAALQLPDAGGFVGGMLTADVPRRTYWTITAWTDEKAMRAYRNTGAHMAAMPKLLPWCDEASVVHWDQIDDTLPTPNELLLRMMQEGRTSKVRHPTAAHSAGETVADGRPPRGATRIVRPRQGKS